MNDKNILMEVPGLYKIILLKDFRSTPGVYFHVLGSKVLPRIDSIDRVIHEKEAVSPGPVENVERPWYMHPHQEDNLMVLHGARYVEIFSQSHGMVENFEVSPNVIKKNNEVVYEGAAMLVWPLKVFHRIVSAEEGSASLNFAVHYDGFDIKTNFNIYDLNTDTGEYIMIRQGYLDQKEL